MFENRKSPGKHFLESSGTVIGVIGVGKVIVKHSCGGIGEPQSSDNVTQYMFPVFIGSTLIVEPFPIGTPFSVQVNVYAVEPPDPTAVKSIDDSEQIIESGETNVIAKGGGSLISTEMSLMQPFASVTVNIFVPGIRLLAVLDIEDEVFQL